MLEDWQLHLQRCGVPVRKIPKNYLVITGRVARGPEKEPAGFECALEQDYYILLKHDPDVEDFEVQPVRIPVPKSRPYVPDVLVHFHPDGSGKQRRPELIEIKPSHLFEEHEQKFAARFAAAESYAAERGWLFLKKDERDIRTTRLEVTRFLRSFLRFKPTEDQTRLILQEIDDLGGECRSSDLLSRVAGNEDEEIVMAPVLWNLVAKREIQMNWDAPLTSDPVIWLGRS